MVQFGTMSFTVICLLQGKSTVIVPCQIAQCAWRAIITYFWQPLISKRIIWIIWIHSKNDNCPLFTELSWIKDLFDSCFPSSEISDSWPLSWTYISYHRSNSSYSVQLTDLFSAAFQRCHIFHPIREHRLNSIGTADLLPWLSKPKVSNLAEIFLFYIRVSVDNDTINNFEGHSNCKFPYFGK